MNVIDIVTKDCFTVTPDTDLVQAAQAMKRHNVGALPVVSDSRLVGIITDRDICIECVAAGCDPHTSRVGDFMTAEPITCAPNCTMEEAIDLMTRHQVRRLPVTDQGRFVGILSIGDLAENCDDDHLVATLLRKVSLPVRSEVPVAAPRTSTRSSSR